MASANATPSNPIAAPAPRRNQAIIRRADELAFLPAALEIVETPPSPVGRAIGATIIAIFCLALIWATFGRIDIVATATGKLVPSGRSKVIQPFETSVVRKIDVQDGQKVKAGDPLIELDTTMNQADVNHLKGDLLAQQVEIARLQAALQPDPMASFAPPEGADPALIVDQRQLLSDQTAAENAKIASLDSQEAQKKAERDTAQATVQKLEAMIPLQQQKSDVYQKVFESGYGSKLQTLTAQLDLTQAKKELGVAQNQYQAAVQALAAITATRQQTSAEYRRQVSDDLTKAEAKADGVKQDLVKAQERTKLQTLAAPIDGEVQQLAIHTVGGVVTPAQSLLVLVPEDSTLEIEAMISNRDVGYVYPGQDVAIKIDTFDFTRFGLFHGKVLSVSSDAITQQKPVDSRNQQDPAAPSDTSEPAGQQLVYAARISIDRTEVKVDDRTVKLAPGMAVTAEIKTGSRRVIDFLLSPLLRLRDDAMTER